jgi:hypothetical protein
MSNSERGRPFSDVWEYVRKGTRQSRGHYSATCTYCNCTWKHGKPQALRQHLANHCKDCSQEVSQYFARVVGQKIGEDEIEESDSDSDSEVPKKSKNTIIKHLSQIFTNQENWKRGILIALIVP